MPKFNIKVYRGYQVRQSAVIEVEAETLDAAIEQQESSDAPAQDDPCWHTEWTLMDEDVSAAI